MVHTSVLIPHRGDPAELLRHLPQITRVLEMLGDPFETIVVDDGSPASAAETLQVELGEHPSARLLRIERPLGVSAVLSAGLAAARGEILVTTEAGRRYPCDQIPALIAGLSRGDMVVGRPRQGGIAKWCRRLTRLPRWLLLGLEVRDPGCLFWAARREAVDAVQLARGMHRYLPTLVALRGFRVCEVLIDTAGPSTMPQRWAHPGDLLATWWLKRRWCMPDFTELNVSSTAQSTATPASIATAPAEPAVWRRAG